MKKTVRPVMADSNMKDLDWCIDSLKSISNKYDLEDSWFQLRDFCDLIAGPVSQLDGKSLNEFSDYLWDSGIHTIIDMAIELTKVYSDVFSILGVII